LNQPGWPKEDIEEVYQSLFRHLYNLQSFDEKIVNDAINVKTLGALGIAKAFITGSAKGQSIEETISIFENQYLA